MAHEFKVGDKVIGAQYGKGEVIENDNESGTITVRFKDCKVFYLPDGRVSKRDIVPSLFRIEKEMFLDNEYPKMMQVWNYEDRKYEAEVLAKTKDGFLSWEDDGEVAALWEHAKDIPQKVKLTLQNISDGLGVGVPAHLIEIVNH